MGFSLLDVSAIMDIPQHVGRLLASPLSDLATALIGACHRFPKAPDRGFTAVLVPLLQILGQIDSLGFPEIGEFGGKHM
jgi:hypothetical protein